MALAKPRNSPAFRCALGEQWKPPWGSRSSPAPPALRRLGHWDGADLPLTSPASPFPLEPGFLTLPSVAGGWARVGGPAFLLRVAVHCSVFLSHTGCCHAGSGPPLSGQRQLGVPLLSRPLCQLPTAICSGPPHVLRKGP